ncbi:unnamed protein product, partial [marine sediment metagenome]
GALIDEPQNGHSVASSSSTDWPQEGHVGKSIKLNSYLSTICQAKRDASAWTNLPTVRARDTFVMAFV